MCQWKRIVLRALVILSKSALSNYIVPETVLRHLSLQQPCETGTMFNLYFTGREVKHRDKYLTARKLELQDQNPVVKFQSLTLKS